MDNKELDQTLVLIKPDALKNSLTGYVLSLLSEFHTGLRFAGTKIVHVSRMLAEEHYAEHHGKVFYPPLLDYIMGLAHYPDEPHKRRVIALVYQGPDAVQKIRDSSAPPIRSVAREKKPGCIRALGTIVPVKDAAGNVVGQRMDNLIHASATNAGRGAGDQAVVQAQRHSAAHADLPLRRCAMPSTTSTTASSRPSMSRAASVCWPRATWPGLRTWRRCACWPRVSRPTARSGRWRPSTSSTNSGENCESFRVQLLPLQFNI